MAKIKEAALPMNTSHGALHGHLTKALMAHHNVTDRWDSGGPYVVDVFPSQVVYQHKGQLYRHPYTATQGAAGADPTITLGKTPKPIHAAYNDSAATEASTLESDDVMITPDTVQVRESVSFDESMAVKEASGPTKVPIKIIQAGWGSSAFYSKEVLQRDGPKVFKAGTHMYWNHATEGEEQERPEGDLSNLAAVLTSDAAWQESGPKGPGLYSNAKVFSDYATQVAEKGPHIGVSINAGIKCHEGTAEGRQGRIADAFVHAFSTDFVTKAGAGGAPIVPVLESHRAQQGEREEQGMTTEETAAHNALVTENAALKGKQTTLEADLASLRRSQDVVVAVATVGAVLREAEIPFKQSMLERVCANPTMKEGKADPDWVKAIVADFTDEQEGGRVRGFGETTREADSDKPAASETRLRKALENLGVNKAGLDFAVKGRA